MAPARRRVFCASLADVFDNEVNPAWRADLFALIERTPNLDWLLLTKRIGNVPAMMREIASHLFWVDHLDTAWLPANVWLGATVVNQTEADRDVPKLLAVPARVRFLSIEPMLGAIDLTRLDLGDLYSLDALRGEETILHDGGMPSKGPFGALHWIIAGGESGPHARPMHPDWVCSLRDQCAAAGAPFLFKQWGEWAPVDSDTPSELQESEELAGKLVDGMHRIGKKAAGRKLDGRTHDGFPAVQP